jgi:cell wall-associated NlpC family hydrolase
MATKAKNTRFLAIACGIAATICLALLALLIVNPFAKGQPVAHQDDSAYAVTIDGSQMSGAGVAPAQAGPSSTQKGGAHVKDVALVRDPEEKYASPEKAGSKPHKIAAMPAASSTTAPAAGAPTTKELKQALHEQKLEGKSASGESVQLAPDGSALAPINAPPVIQKVIAAGNNIKNYPYIWGGGHGSFQDNGYDCSGSVSYALAGGGLLNAPLTSGELANTFEPGPGKWISIYANAGHVFMFVGGLRFDTSFRDGPRGTRWQNGNRPLAGFEIRHPAGL